MDVVSEETAGASHQPMSKVGFSYGSMEEPDIPSPAPSQEPFRIDPFEAAFNEIPEGLQLPDSMQSHRVRIAHLREKTTSMTNQEQLAKPNSRFM